MREKILLLNILDATTLAVALLSLAGYFMPANIVIYLSLLLFIYPIASYFIEGLIKRGLQIKTLSHDYIRERRRKLKLISLILDAVFFLHLIALFYIGLNWEEGNTSAYPLLFIFYLFLYGLGGFHLKIRSYCEI